MSEPVTTEPLDPVFEVSTSKFHVVGKLSKDRIKLFVDIELLEKGKVTKAELEELLAPKVDIQLVNAAVLEDIAKHLPSQKKIIERRIAKGKLPEAGANGKLLLLVKLLTGEVEVKLDDKNRASFHDLHLFDNIAKGQAIARLYPPKEGVEGVSALGERLPATPGTAATVNHDKTITMLAAMEGEPYQLLIAEEEGLVKQADGILTIQGEFEIGENLDFRYGNIDFVGAVKIKGDVQPGFSVRAKKGIFITGSVQGGTLEAIQGPIEVKGLVYGGEKSRIIAGDRFVADSVQEVFAEIRGEIVIKKEARDSILMSQTIIQMPTARLIGGKAYTVCGAEFRELGSETEKETVVILCSAVEASKSFSDLIAQIESHEQAEQLINLHLGPLAGKKIRLDMIKPEHRDKIGKLIKKQDSIKESKQKLIDKKTEILAKSHSSEIMRVNVHKTIFPGVIVRAQDVVLKQQEQKEGPLSIDFQGETKQFVFGPLQAVECKINADVGAAAAAPKAAPSTEKN